MLVLGAQYDQIVRGLLITTRSGGPKVARNVLKVCDGHGQFSSVREALRGVAGVAENGPGAK